MVTIKAQANYRITIYPREHGIPHVHVVGPDFQAKVSIEDATIIAGSPPASHRRAALRWIAANHDMLLIRWDEITKL